MPTLQKLKQIYSKKFFFFFKNCNSLVPSPPERKKLRKKPLALKREHPLLGHPENIYFCGSFLASWIRIRIPNMDPDTHSRTCLNPDPILIRIRIRNTVHNSKGRYLSIYPFYMFRSPLSGWPQAVLHSGELSAALIPPLLSARLFIAAPTAALLVRIEPENMKENKTFLNE
jgi:hypothetical protein